MKRFLLMPTLTFIVLTQSGCKINLLSGNTVAIPVSAPPLPTTLPENGAIPPTLSYPWGSGLPTQVPVGVTRLGDPQLPISTAAVQAHQLKVQSALNDLNRDLASLDMSYDRNSTGSQTSGAAVSWPSDIATDRATTIARPAAPSPTPNVQRSDGRSVIATTADKIPQQSTLDSSGFR